MKKAIVPTGIETICSGAVNECAVLVDNERIAGIVSVSAIPGDYEIDRWDGVLTPGLIETHCHLGVHQIEVSGVSDCNEMVDPVTPHVRAEDGVNPFDRGFEIAMANGVTTVHVLPGSANVFGGRGVVLSTVPGSLAEKIIKRDYGMKAAFGENPRGVYASKSGPFTRMGIAALFRTWMVKAEVYRARQEKAASAGQGVSQDTGQGDRNDKIPERDLKLEALTGLLTGEDTLRAHAHRADDILTAMRLAREFGIKLRIEHGTQALEVVDEIMREGILISYGPLLSPPKKYENAGRDVKTAAALIRRGVVLSLSTDHPVTCISTLQVMASMLGKYDVKRDEALAAVTVNAARILDLGDQLGEVREGLRADLVVWSGDPLDVRNFPLAVYVGGKICHRAQRPS